MAHEIDFSNNKANFAFTGSRDAIWHGHGQALEIGASIEEWASAAGFDWTAQETPVLFRNSAGHIVESEDKKVLFRSDLQTELAVVGSSYKVVQPKEVLEFFRDLVEGTGMYLDTAGMLFGGRRFFASANTSKAAYIGHKDDTVLGNLLLATSVDGTLATNAGFFSTRVVCNNTLRFALSEDTSAKKVRVTHRQQFNPAIIKRDLGLIDNAWEKFVENMNKLASKKVDDATAKDILATIFLKKKEGAEQPSPQSVTQFDKAVGLYANGMGSDMANGTLWGVMNSVTEMCDHHNRVRTSDAKAWDKFFGKINDIKNDAAELCLSLV